MAEANEGNQQEVEQQGNTQEHTARVAEDGLDQARVTMAQAAEEVLSEEDQPAVLLVVPTVKVDEINLDVEDLQARISLHAELANMLKLDVGVSAHLGRVNLEIKGVEAQALLKVRLRTVADILDRVLTTIDNNPEVLRSVLQPVSEATRELGESAGQAVENVGQGAGGAVDDVGQGAGQATSEVGEAAGQTASQAGEAAGEAGQLTGQGQKSQGDQGQSQQQGRGQRQEQQGGRQQSQGSQSKRSQPQQNGESTTGMRDSRQHLGESTDEKGRTVRRTINRFGDISEETLTEDGQVMQEQIVGSVKDLAVVEETMEDGRTVRRVRDQSGIIIRQELDEEGNLIQLEVQPAGVEN
jgi:hypothetical protein